MKYLGVLLLGMLLGALIYREIDIWRSPALAGRQDCLPCSTSTPSARERTEPASTSSEATPASQGAGGPIASRASKTVDTTPVSPTPAAAAASGLPAGLLIPVQGKSASDLTDTFTDARSQGRSHDAIDIMAAAGTPVLAVADGQIEKLFNSQRGGLTVYQFESTGKYAYYYAHLQRYADGLAEKQMVRRGQVIGYVGSTGNADPAAPHLHFAIFLLGPERRWWEGSAINPYPFLSQTEH